MKREPAYSGPIQRTSNSIDYVDNDGILHVDSETKSIMVRNENDLNTLTGYVPGTFAYTAGFQAMWQLSAAGTWVSIGGGE